MDGVFWLVLASCVVALGGNRPAAIAGATALATMAGTTLPDIDQWLPLGHRSALTHSVLPLAVALSRPAWRPVAAGLGLGLGLHLAADVFPNAMIGFALVRLPLLGALSPWDSRLWLAANALAATAAGGALLAGLLAPRWAWATALAAGAIGIAYLVVTDGGWPALLAYGAAGAAWRWSRG